MDASETLLSNEKYLKFWVKILLPDLVLMCYDIFHIMIYDKFTLIFPSYIPILKYLESHREAFL